MDAPPQHIDIAEFSSEGYIIEVNRRVLHPLGLALERQPGLTRQQVEDRLLAAGAHRDPALSGVPWSALADMAWATVVVLGLDRDHLSGVWDCRDDPEGVSYAGDVLQRVRDAAAHVEQVWSDRFAPRVEALGYMVQPA